MASIFLIPNGAGDETSLEGVVGASEHWQACISKDDDTSYVYDGGAQFGRDLFNLENTGISGHTITKVTVRAYVKATAAGSGVATTSIKTNGQVYDGNAEDIGTTSYTIISTDYTTNPQSGSAWTWDEINALQAGIQLKRPSPNQQTRCTLVQVIVYFTVGTQIFYPIDPVEVTPGTASAWTDVDVSSYVPSGATGVILHIVNNSATTYEASVRKNGSTDDRHRDISYNSHQWTMIGVDANRVFEAYVENTTSIDIYLVGYTMSGVTFKTNADDKSLGTAGSWQDVDCSTEAPSAIGLIWEVYTGGYNLDFGLRKNGSSDDRYVRPVYPSWAGAIIGCDTSQVCEGKIESTDVDFYLLGYVTDGATFNTNATDVSLTTTGAWTDLSALPSGANMGFIEVIDASIGQLDYGLRKNGSSEDIYQMVYAHTWGIVECDASQIIEGKIENTNVDFFVVGYSTAVTITEKSSSDTGSGAEASLPTATLSQVDSGGGVEALLSRGLGAAEVGAGTEVYTLLVALVATAETGSGAEFASKAFGSADSASGVESLVARLLATSETGIGTETLLSRLLRHTDSGLGADATLTLLATLARAETGSGVDAFVNLITAALASSETGSGVDKLLGRAISLLDAGSGLDVATLRKVLLSTDSGVGLEALADLLALIITAETGSASEQLKAKIMTSAGAADMKLPTKMGKARISFKGVNQ